MKEGVVRGLLMLFLHCFMLVVSNNETLLALWVLSNLGLFAADFLGREQS